MSSAGGFFRGRPRGRFGLSSAGGFFLGRPSGFPLGLYSRRYLARWSSRCLLRKLRACTTSEIEMFSRVSMAPSWWSSRVIFKNLSINTPENFRLYINTRKKLKWLRDPITLVHSDKALSSVLEIRFCGYFVCCGCFSVTPATASDRACDGVQPSGFIVKNGWVCEELWPAADW